MRKDKLSREEQRRVRIMLQDDRLDVLNGRERYQEYRWKSLLTSTVSKRNEVKLLTQNDVASRCPTVLEAPVRVCGSLSVLL